MPRKAAAKKPAVPVQKRDPDTGRWPLETQLAAVLANKNLWAPRWPRIGRFANGAAATAAVALLRKRHGDNEEVEGWRFEARKIPNRDETGIFVQYNPEAVIPGRKEENDRKYREYKERLAVAKRQEMVEDATKEDE